MPTCLYPLLAVLLYRKPLTHLDTHNCMRHDARQHSHIIAHCTAPSCASSTSTACAGDPKDETLCRRRPIGDPSDIGSVSCLHRHGMELSALEPTTNDIMPMNLMSPLIRSAVTHPES